MGIFGKRMKDPIRGEGYVVSCWDRPEADKGDCRVTLTVRAAGVSSRTVEVSEKNVRKEMWPRSGQTLPITVDRADPENVKVEWDSVGQQAASPRPPPRRRRRLNPPRAPPSKIKSSRHSPARRSMSRAPARSSPSWAGRA